MADLRAPIQNPTEMYKNCKKYDIQMQFDKH